MPSVFSSDNYLSIYYPGYGYPWVPVTTGHQQQSSKIIGTIGIITDIHYTDKNPTDRRFRDSPIFTGNNHYMCKNHFSVRKILEADKNVIAVFNGHHHPGAHGWWEDIKNNPYSNVYHTATGVFGEKYNGIKYYNLRGSIIGWGSDPGGPIEKPSNVYYILTVKRGSTVSIEVKSFRTN